MTSEELVNEYIQVCKHFRQKRKAMLKKLANIDELTVKDNIVKNSNLCIILSCPGEEELIEQKVCVGKTGRNLECVLELVLLKFNKKIIGRSDSSAVGDFQEGFRYNYTILNASNKVYFRALNSAEASEDEIIDTKNITRVEKMLEGLKIKYFLICGKNAEMLFDKINARYPTALCSKICHVGDVGIRRKYPNSYSIGDGFIIDDLPENERDSKRFKLISEQIIQDWK